MQGFLENTIKCLFFSGKMEFYFCLTIGTLNDNIAVKPVLSGHSKIYKTKVFMESGSLMKVESIAECSPWSCNTFDLHYVIIGLENHFLCSF